MFSENLRTMRKAKGITQEELAMRLNVVRQTVSKWEKGLSVPDADLLIRISEILEVSTSVLLGAKIENEQDTDMVAEQLSRINEQLAYRSRHTRRLIKTILIVAGIVLFMIVFWTFGQLMGGGFQGEPTVNPGSSITAPNE